MSGLLLIAASCVAPPAPVVVAPIPPGQARVWFYRPYEPSETFNLARIEMNGGRYLNTAAAWRMPIAAQHGCVHAWNDSQLGAERVC